MTKDYRVVGLFPGGLRTPFLVSVAFIASCCGHDSTGEKGSDEDVAEWRLRSLELEFIAFLYSAEPGPSSDLEALFEEHSEAASRFRELVASAEILRGDDGPSDASSQATATRCLMALLRDSDWRVRVVSAFFIAEHCEKSLSWDETGQIRERIRKSVRQLAEDDRLAVRLCMADVLKHSSHAADVALFVSGVSEGLESPRFVHRHNACTMVWWRGDLFEDRVGQFKRLLTGPMGTRLKEVVLVALMEIGSDASTQVIEWASHDHPDRGVREFARMIVYDLNSRAPAEGGRRR